MLHTLSVFFFFNDTATTEIYTLSLHDALPICSASIECGGTLRFSSWESEAVCGTGGAMKALENLWRRLRSEEHTSELQSPCNIVCRLLLEKKKMTLSTTFTLITSCGTHDGWLT